MQINKEKPDIASILEKVTDDKLNRVYTSIPAKIVSVDDKTVSVQILIKEKNISGEYVDLPVINDVPVRTLRGSNFIIGLPIKPDDTGTLIFFRQSIKNWRLSGEISQPEDDRKFNLSDCAFMPDIAPDNDSLSSVGEDLTIQYAGATITITSDGNIMLQSAETGSGIVLNTDNTLNVTNSNGSAVRVNTEGDILFDTSAGAATMRINNDGTIEAGLSADFKAVLGETIRDEINAQIVTIFNTHTHPSIGAPPATQMTAITDSVLSDIVTIK